MPTSFYDNDYDEEEEAAGNNSELWSCDGTADGENEDGRRSRRGFYDDSGPCSEQMDRYDCSVVNSDR